jgi:hypothetical protein
MLMTIVTILMTIVMMWIIFPVLMGIFAQPAEKVLE